MKKIFFASVLFLAGAHFVQGLLGQGGDAPVSLANNNVREGPRSVTRDLASSMDKKRMEQGPDQKKIKNSILDLEREIDRYSQHLDYLYSTNRDEERSRQEMRLNEGGDADLSKQDQEFIEDHMKRMQEVDELREKFKNEVPSDEMTEVDFYEQLIRVKQDQIDELERQLK